MDEVRQVVTSIGATAEMLGIFRKNLRHQGFSGKESMELTKTFLHEIITFNKIKEDN